MGKLLEVWNPLPNVTRQLASCIYQRLIPRIGPNSQNSNQIAALGFASSTPQRIEPTGANPLPARTTHHI